jgi:hypothetical protein
MTEPTPTLRERIKIILNIDEIGEAEMLDRIIEAIKYRIPSEKEVFGNFDNGWNEAITEVKQRFFY